ncbi:MAG TPA: hypothetical protein VM285_08760 [Polyangia bacterium]|nr:hypothetical protein [Polyangia bacterium]
MKRDVSIIVLATALIAAAPGREARADAAKDTGGDRTVVMIAERHDEAASGTVVRAVQAQLSDVSVALQVSWTDSLGRDLPAQIAAAEALARESNAVAVFWCDLTRADRIYLYFAAPRGGRVLVRELEGSGAGGRAEALAIIVRNSVEAVLAGGEIGEIVPSRPERGESVAPSPPPEAAPEAGDGRLAMAVSYQPDVVSVADPVIHAAALALYVKLIDGISLTAGYALSAPLEAEVRGVLLELGRHPAWIGCRGSWRAGRLRVAAELDFQLDFTTEKVRTLAQGVTVSSGGLEVQPSIVPSLRSGVSLVRRVELFFAAGADIALHRTRYVIDTAGGPEEILSTWPVRPRFLAGLEVVLW